MKAVTWQGRRDIRVEEVPEPRIEQPTDAIVRITSTGLCGSDLHLYDPLTPFMTPGDVVGHEPMGIVEEVGAEVHSPRGGGPGRGSVQHQLRLVLDVRPAAAQPVRDHPEPRPGHRREPVRLQLALRAGPGRPGRAAARAVRRLPARQGPRGTARRPVPVPVRRAAHRVAGGGVRLVAAERAVRAALLEEGLQLEPGRIFRRAEQPRHGEGAAGIRPGRRRRVRLAAQPAAQEAAHEGVAGAEHVEDFDRKSPPDDAVVDRSPGSRRGTRRSPSARASARSSRVESDADAAKGVEIVLLAGGDVDLLLRADDQVAIGAAPACRCSDTFSERM